MIVQPVSIGAISSAAATSQMASGGTPRASFVTTKKIGSR